MSNLESLNSQLQQFASNLGIQDLSKFQNLKEQEARYILEYLREYSETGQTKLDDVLWSLDYEEKPVDIIQFIEDPKYLGNVGRLLYPKWKEELWHVLRPGSRIIEWIFSGAIGIGKTTVANIAHAYKLYKLLCLKKPVEYYDLMGEGMTTLAIGLFNVNMSNAWSVNYKQFKAIVQSSPWFSGRVGHNRNNTWVQFTKDIVIVLGSRNAHALGKAIVGGAMDEADFTDSKDYKETTDIYTAIKRRMESRFLEYMYTEPPGLLTLISSTVQDDQSFINQRIELAHKNPELSHVSQFPVWVVKPVPESLDQRKFWCFVGSELAAPTIIPLKELFKYEETTLIEVPNIYRPSFEEDIDRALLDIAGVRVGTRKSSFLRRMDLLQLCMQDRRTFHPFISDGVVLTIDSPTPLKDFFDVARIFMTYEDVTIKRGPIVNPHVPRFFHVDLAKNGDAAGLACVHCSGFEEITEPVPETDYTRKLQVPKFSVDLMVQINSSIGSEIDFSKIRDFIFFLHANGMKIGGISYDSWNSVDSLQHYKKSKITENVETISVDRTHEAYSLLRSLIITTRLSIYNHSVFVKEIRELIRDADTKRCDHPSKGSKDVADGVAGAIWHCSRYYKIRQGAIDEPLREVIEYMSKEKYDVQEENFHLPKRKKKSLNI